MWFFLSAIALAGAAPELWPSACREQVAQEFLIRANMKKDKAGFAAAVAKAIRYRTAIYGHVPGAPFAEINPVSAPSQAIAARFLGLDLRLHRKVAPVLACVEAELGRTCAAPGDAYVPRYVGGLRTRNTYRGGEISNHMFGIAVDIDPDRNPCCGCVPPWSEDPRCRKRVSSIFERAEVTRCWVRAFEKYGFYWLGWDEMGDAMHFEFLGEPSAI